MVVTEDKRTGLSVLTVTLDGSFDVGKTFDCGQCFRFDPVENSSHEIEYSGVAFGRLVSFGQDGNTLYIYNSTAEDYRDLWRHYLGLDVDYSDIRTSLLKSCDSPQFASAVQCGEGIRILNQDPYETVISFIISQNNNIPRIKQIIERLCTLCGDKIEVPEGMESHLSGKSSLCTFPTAERLYSLGVDGLFAAKTGFRAKYIYDALGKILTGQIDPALPMGLDSTAEGMEYLCEIKGVGPKVASCILLFSCERYDAFPVDVWIKKAMAKYFPEKDFSFEFFGAYAGIAQQYLFYYERYLGGE